MNINSLAVPFSFFLLLVTSVIGPQAVLAETPEKADLPAGYVEEAPLPEGFPPPSEPGKVVEKTYPVVRSYSATGADSFMKCFVYLTTNQHKMTAPVVMECSPELDTSQPAPGDGVPVPFERMHFLLEKNSLDKPHEAGPVEVADMPALRVLSISYQGDSKPELIKKGQAAIEARLKELPDVERAGNYRLLGYNNPMSNPSKNFWELQLPIRAKSSDK
jgi:hypothetical protein